MNEHDGVCVCTACPDKHGELVAVFDSVAQQYHGEYTFGFMELPGSSDSEPRVECLNQIGGKKKTYAQDGRGLEAFVLEALRPTIVDLTPDNYERLLNVCVCSSRLIELIQLTYTFFLHSVGGL